MELRPLGHAPLGVTPIGIGCWQFSNRKNIAGLFWPALDTVPHRDIIRAALDGGVNWFDTAEMYGKGASEQAVAEGLAAAGRKPGDVLVATKWSPFLRFAGNMRKTVRERIRRLDPYPVGLYQVHSPAALSPVPSLMKVLAELIDYDEIQAAGVSNFSADQMRRAHAALAAHGHPLASNQVEYNLFNRRIEHNGVLDAAKELGVTIIAYSPLAMGLLSGKFHDDPGLIKSRPGLRKYMSNYRRSGLRKTQPLIDALREIAEHHGATPAQVALNWLVHFHGDTVVAIPGATKVRHAQDNVKALSFTLSQEELHRLDAVSQTLME